MSKEIYEEVREWVKDPQHGSEDYGQLGALPKHIRATIHKLCDFAESADKVVISLLTPPTAEELCEELMNIKWDGFKLKKVIYNDDDFELHADFGMGDAVAYLSQMQFGWKEFVKHPEIITMIGRFYENEVKE